MWLWLVLNKLPDRKEIIPRSQHFAFFQRPHTTLSVFAQWNTHTQRSAAGSHKAQKSPLNDPGSGQSFLFSAFYCAQWPTHNGEQQAFVPDYSSPPSSYKTFCVYVWVSYFSERHRATLCLRCFLDHWTVKEVKLYAASVGSDFIYQFICDPSMLASIQH